MNFYLYLVLFVKKIKKNMKEIDFLCRFHDMLSKDFYLSMLEYI